MPTESNLLNYHKSITQELVSVQNRVRNLIGDAHWLSEGEYKESVLRKVLQSHVPDTIRVGRGFIFYENSDLSHQVDVLLTDKSRPTLFSEDGFSIVTPDSVKSIIEVKANIHTIGQFRKIVSKLSLDAEKVRRESKHNIWVGLFAFEAGDLPDDKLLKVLQKETANNPTCVINCICLGTDKFIRFIKPSEFTRGYREEVSNGWAHYHLENLSSAYFISHTIWGIEDGDYNVGKFAWFPVHRAARNYGTKFAYIHDKRVIELPAYMLKQDGDTVEQTSPTKA